MDGSGSSKKGKSLSGTSSTDNQTLMEWLCYGLKDLRLRSDESVRQAQQKVQEAQRSNSFQDILTAYNEQLSTAKGFVREAKEIDETVHKTQGATKADMDIAKVYLKKMTEEQAFIEKVIWQLHCQLKSTREKRESKGKKGKKHGASSHHQQQDDSSASHAHDEADSMEYSDTYLHSDGYSDGYHPNRRPPGHYGHGYGTDPSQHWQPSDDYEGYDGDREAGQQAAPAQAWQGVAAVRPERGHRGYDADNSPSTGKTQKKRQGKEKAQAESSTSEWEDYVSAEDYAGEGQDPAQDASSQQAGYDAYPSHQWYCTTNRFPSSLGLRAHTVRKSRTATLSRRTNRTIHSALRNGSRCFRQI
ncbi:hypothetical protein B0T16DRAFT_214066 [Cercophora newfieldiana]|uniref:Uncharacterized protein n=1 Tax=Cercophora newfieldiana TaxID=92897 RepID=A0AA39XW53_9PEZI|nr:hypothetical protein B0T16DRAFT_214066 [Cercophora newfieldiana]